MFSARSCKLSSCSRPPLSLRRLTEHRLSAVGLLWVHFLLANVVCPNETLAGPQITFTPPKTTPPIASHPSQASSSHQLLSYRGWSTWSLEAFKAQGYGASWLTESHVKTAADVVSRDFARFGFDRINLDSGWQDDQLDRYGRTILNRKKFPSGIQGLQSYMRERGLELGLYYIPGIDARAVKAKSPVLGSNYTADQLIFCPDQPLDPPSGNSKCVRPLANSFQANFALNYAHPASQLFVNSIVDQLYLWNVSFVKLDGLVPGSSFHPSAPNITCDTRPDWSAWRRAIDQGFEQKWQHVNRRKIWLVGSWELPPTVKNDLDPNLDSWRVAADIEAYSTQMTTFDRVVRSAKKGALWSSVDTNRPRHGFLDLDSILVSDMTLAESQSMVTIWAMLGSPLYLGDDLSKLPQERKALLQNPEVLDVQALAGRNPSRLFHYNISNSEPPSDSQLLVAHTTSSGLDWMPNKIPALDSAALEHSCLAWATKRELLFRYMVTEGATYDFQADKQDCMRTSAAFAGLQSNLQKRATTGGGPPNAPDDEWSQQLWVTGDEKTGDIYLAVINAGHQTSSDRKVDYELSLEEVDVLISKATKMSARGKSYKLRDLWKQKDLGYVDFGARISIHLGVHECVLLNFAPVH